MDLGSAFFVLAIIVLIGLYISQPFFEKETKQSPQSLKNHADEDHIRSTLLAERDRLLNTLEELDFDNVLGKIPAGEYAAQRAVLLNTGAQLLRQLDSYQEQTSAETAEARLEAAIAMRRADSAPAIQRENIPSDDGIEELISSRRQTRSEQAAGFCPKCGRAVQKSDRFCPKCGSQL